MRNPRRRIESEPASVPARWIALLCALMAVGLMLVTRPLPVRTSSSGAHAATHEGAPPLRPMPGSQRVAPRHVAAPSRSTQFTPLPSGSVGSQPSGVPLDSINTVGASHAIGTIPPITATVRSTTTSTPSRPVAPSTASIVSDTIEHGWLEGPTWTSSIYQVAASSPHAVVATWTSGATLTLSVTCSDGSQQITKIGGATLQVPAGPCTITLSGGASTPLTTYQIDVGPAR